MSRSHHEVETQRNELCQKLTAIKENIVNLTIHELSKNLINSTIDEYIIRLSDPSLDSSEKLSVAAVEIQKKLPQQLARQALNPEIEQIINNFSSHLDKKNYYKVTIPEVLKKLKNIQSLIYSYPDALRHRFKKETLSTVSRDIDYLTELLQKLDQIFSNKLTEKEKRTMQWKFEAVIDQTDFLTRCTERDISACEPLEAITKNAIEKSLHRILPKNTDEDNNPLDVPTLRKINQLTADARAFNISYTEAFMKIQVLLKEGHYKEPFSLFSEHIASYSSNRIHEIQEFLENLKTYPTSYSKPVLQMMEACQNFINTTKLHPLATVTLNDLENLYLKIQSIRQKALQNPALSPEFKEFYRQNQLHYADKTFSQRKSIEALEKAMALINALDAKMKSNTLNKIKTLYHAVVEGNKKPQQALLAAQRLTHIAFANHRKKGERFSLFRPFQQTPEVLAVFKKISELQIISTTEEKRRLEDRERYAGNKLVLEKFKFIMALIKHLSSWKSQTLDKILLLYEAAIKEGKPLNEALIEAQHLAATAYENHREIGTGFSLFKPFRQTKEVLEVFRKIAELENTLNNYDSEEDSDFDFDSSESSSSDNEIS